MMPIVNTCCKFKSSVQEDIGKLAAHYGRPLQDQFQGNRTVGQPVFQQDIIQQQFSAFKHHMFLLRY